MVRVRAMCFEGLGLKASHTTRRFGRAISKRDRYKRFEAGRGHVHVNADDNEPEICSDAQR